MVWLPLLAASAAAKIFGAKKANDQKKKEMAAADKAARAKHAVNETQRRGAVDFLNQGAASRGIKGVIPAPFVERPYTGPDMVEPSLALTLFDTLGDVAGEASAYFVGKEEREQQQKERMQIICAVYPTAPGCPGASTAPRSAPTIPGTDYTGTD